MPTYVMLKKAPAEKLADALRKDKKALDELVKRKGDKKAIQAATKKYEADAKVFAKLVEGDIATAKKGFVSMSKFVQDSLTRAMKLTSQARGDLKTITPGAKAEAALRAYSSLGADVKDLQATANEEMKNFAISWNEYREANFGLEPAVVKAFQTVRTSIIDETIKVRAQERKIEALAVEAGTLQNALYEKGQGYATDADNKLDLANQVLSSMQTTIKNIKTKSSPDRLIGATDAFEKWLKAPWPEFSGSASVRAKSYNDYKSSAQQLSTTLSTLKRSVGTFAQSLTEGDLKENRDLAKVAREVDTTFKEFSAEVTAALAEIPKLARLVNQAQERLKQGS